MRRETFWQRAEEHMAIPFGDKTKQRKMREQILRMNGTAFWPKGHEDGGLTVMVSMLIGRPVNTNNYRARSLTAPYTNSDVESFYKTNVLHSASYDNSTGVFVVKNVLVRLTDNEETSQEEVANQTVDIVLDTRGSASKLGAFTLFTEIEPFVDLTLLPSTPSQLSLAQSKGIPPSI